MAATPASQSPRDSAYNITRAVAIATLVIAPIAYGMVMRTLYNSGMSTRSFQFGDVLLWILLAVALLQVTVLIPLITRWAAPAIRNNPTSRAKPGSGALSMIILRLAIVESVYIFGLLYFLLTYELNRSLVFFLIGAFASVAYWPTRNRFDEIANALEGK